MFIPLLLSQVVMVLSPTPHICGVGGAEVTSLYVMLFSGHSPFLFPKTLSFESYVIKLYPPLSLLVTEIYLFVSVLSYFKEFRP